jgi:hypothetical protein
MLADSGITYSNTLAYNGLTVSGIQINEYLAPSEEYAAKNAWWIAQLDRAGVNAAMHAIWIPGPSVFGALDGIDSLSSGTYETKATWYDYKAYGDITGNTLTTTPGTYADLVAGVTTSGTKTVTVLVGTQSGISSGTLQVKCTNVSSIFSGRTTVTVTLNDIPNSSGGFITAETPIYTENVPVVNNTAYIYIPYNNNQDAYEITIQ